MKRLAALPSQLFFALFASLLIAGCLSAQSAGWHFIPHEFAPVFQFIQAGNTGPAARLEPPAGGALARKLALHRRSRARVLRLAGASFGFLTGDERETKGADGSDKSLAARRSVSQRSRAPEFVLFASTDKQQTSAQADFTYSIAPEKGANSGGEKCRLVLYLPGRLAMNKGAR